MRQRLWCLWYDTDKPATIIKWNNLNEIQSWNLFQFIEYWWRELRKVTVAGEFHSKNLKCVSSPLCNKCGQQMSGARIALRTKNIFYFRCQEVLRQEPQKSVHYLQSASRVNNEVNVVHWTMICNSLQMWKKYWSLNLRFSKDSHKTLLAACLPVCFIISQLSTVKFSLRCDLRSSGNNRTVAKPKLVKLFNRLIAGKK